jgi:hypothetical protein
MLLSTGLAAAPRRDDRVRQPPRFFEAELLGMNEASHRVVVDFQPRSASSVTSPHRGDIVAPDPLRQPDWVFPEIAFGL